MSDNLRAVMVALALAVLELGDALSEAAEATDESWVKS